MNHTIILKVGRFVILSLALVAGSTLHAAPLAELVSIRTEDNVLLHGLLYSPQQKSDLVVIHIPGGPGSFYSIQDMSPLAQSLMQNGAHFLSMNTRTAGGMGMSGMMYTRFEDYLYDVAAAVQLAEDRGLSRILLLGHSLGSARVFYYHARTHNPAIKGIVVSGAITSPYLEAQMRWNETERKKFDDFLAEQRARIKAGHGRELVSYPWAPGRELTVSAATWVSIFGNLQDSNASTVKFAKEIDVPVLIVHGTADTTAIPQNAEEIYASLKPDLQKKLIVVEGADHLFREHTREYADAVSAWVKENFPASK